MSLLVVGTIPIHPGAVFAGPVERADDGTLLIGGERCPVCQGTPAMLLAAEAVSRHLAMPRPYALLGGDLGRGDGTRAVYHRLEDAIRESEAHVVAFHYLQPIMALMRDAIGRLAPRADAGELVLVADAGGMYAAKASGVASHFELMTPDAGEVGFLADPDVSHPAYVARHLLGNDGFDPADLARRAAESKGAARVLLIKGVTDHVAVNGEVVASVDSPDVPQLEAIGGTGDTITGLAAALIAAGMPTVEAAVCAARVNREAGRRLEARPDHRASDLVDHFPGALGEHVGPTEVSRASQV